MNTYCLFDYVYDKPTLHAITGGIFERGQSYPDMPIGGILDLVPLSIEPRYRLSEKMIVLTVIWVHRYVHSPLAWDYIRLQYMCFVFMVRERLNL